MSFTRIVKNKPLCKIFLPCFNEDLKKTVERKRTCPEKISYMVTKNKSCSKADFYMKAITKGKKESIWENLNKLTGRVNNNIKKNIELNLNGILIRVCKFMSNVFSPYFVEFVDYMALKFSSN